MRCRWASSSYIFVVVDRFLYALFSALEQTRYAHVACDSETVTLLFHFITIIEQGRCMSHTGPDACCTQGLLHVSSSCPPRVSVDSRLCLKRDFHVIISGVQMMPWQNFVRIAPPKLGIVICRLMNLSKEKKEEERNRNRKDREILKAT